MKSIIINNYMLTVVWLARLLLVNCNFSEIPKQVG